ncbi:MAG: hypothetical protein ACTHMP_14395, partial [Thermomicrobiales bacterium]
MASIVLGYVVYLFRWRMWAAAVVIIASTFSVDLPGEYYAGPLAVGSVAAATNGETAYNYAVQAVGATYVWGAPTRDAAHMGSMSQPSFDCSGLIWEVATMMASVVPDLAANPPATSQAWWFYGHSIVGTPWDNNLPTGALLFLHDDRLFFFFAY